MAKTHDWVVTRAVSKCGIRHNSIESSRDPAWRDRTTDRHRFAQHSGGALADAPHPALPRFVPGKLFLQFAHSTSDSSPTPIIRCSAADDGGPNDKRPTAGSVGFRRFPIRDCAHVRERIRDFWACPAINRDRVRHGYPVFRETSSAYRLDSVRISISVCGKSEVRAADEGQETAAARQFQSRAGQVTSQ